MGSLERRARAREETRTKILDAARALFVSEGFEAVTMRKIARSIEYSPTALYVHFRDKVALMRELCERDFVEFAAQFAGLTQIRDPLERLRRAGIAYVEFALAYSNQYRLLFLTPHPHFPKESQGGNAAEDAYGFIKQIFTQAIAEGRLRPELTDPDALAQSAWAAVHGLASLHIICTSDEIAWRPPKPTAEMLCETLVRGISRTP